MYEVRVEADFAAAHFLTDYHGKCERLHGHNYRVLAHAQGTELDEGGMLFDFGILKKALREVCAQLDHRNLNDFSFFNGNPSAERIAEFIFTEIKKLSPDCPLVAVDVYETPTSRARFYQENRLVLKS
ncbi:6-carboxytetrahydropterin synthase QueD [Treponema phagedenis]|uniref:6-carboxytetrahydropterin synthase QueD n=1 Tax=Treponema phagedenis TaxID=162 RepID=UPI0001F63C54|nr:6-carboxytetrahydropterin synthase QueD [Treponema phagedenis]EFW37941.1 queuosine biosynthesis protein QueD [Treponema phagedenis F0421]TYT76462.1 6-carboxytetrahydropterin synthase QueD [Treponema phagedenis]TYT76880.1 6-carboxytetrahydropterin synthase QueD [Treponema phagedenis]TYT79830.1 6-carboxytetrahydropterin synthase QueD [Treponema phagedenis]